MIFEAGLLGVGMLGLVLFLLGTRLLRWPGWACSIGLLLALFGLYSGGLYWAGGLASHVSIPSSGCPLQIPLRTRPPFMPSASRLISFMPSRSWRPCDPSDDAFPVPPGSMGGHRSFDCLDARPPIPALRRGLARRPSRHRPRRDDRNGAVFPRHSDEHPDRPTDRPSLG